MVSILMHHYLKNNVRIMCLNLLSIFHCPGRCTSYLQVREQFAVADQIGENSDRNQQVIFLSYHY